MRRKEYKGKSPEWIVVQRADDHFKEEHAAKRRARVRGENTYRTTGTNSQVVESKKSVDRAIVRGFVYYLDDWLDLMRAPKSLKTLAQKVEWAESEHRQTVKKKQQRPVGR